MIPYILIGIAIVFLILYLRSTITQPKATKVHQQESIIPQKPTFGRLRIYFGSQTGTSAKLAEQLSDEGLQQGFSPQIIDLKDIKINHFQSINQISLFLLSNTGEGDAPQNCVKWMKVLRGKDSLDETRNLDWSKINYSVFGLGNTQYEHYNKTGIDADSLLSKNGASRLYKLGLGDDNCSLEDDFTEWKKELWSTLKQFRATHPLRQAVNQEKIIRKISSESVNTFNYISKTDPIYANFKIFIKNNEEDYQFKDQDLDFMTKSSLKSQLGQVVCSRQLRQDQKDGSTLQVQIQLSQKQYQTAGNIALYGKNDPKIINQIITYFGLTTADLDKSIGLSKVNQGKKLKLNFVPKTLRSLLQESIDIQSRLSKSVIKKLAKFQSLDASYFTENSLKTTQQFKRITEGTDKGEWYYLIRLIKQKQVKLIFEDFIELSDAMAPRLFTIASHFHTQTNITVAASLVENGLISKYLQLNPKSLKAELRKSTFTDAMKWKKVIFIATGTGIAPFRSYLQQKQYVLNLRKQGKEVNSPIVSLFFGCKHQNGDFIYKEQILKWKESGVIDRLHMAFSRDSDKKVYVQDLLQKQQAELLELSHCQETALYICGSKPMGHSIVQLLTKAFGAQKVVEMQSQGRIVKELW